MGIFDNNIKNNLQPTEDVLRSALITIVTDCTNQFKYQACDIDTLALTFVTAFCDHLSRVLKLHGGLLDTLHPGIETYVFEPSPIHVCMPDKHTLNTYVTVVLYIPTGIIDPAYKIERQKRYQFDIPVQIHTQ